MSGNHYPHIPPPINMHSVNANKQKNDYVAPPTSVNQWAMNQPNEFENREKYMETQLTEEHYNTCDLDSNANQNEIVDDEPYPPPGLRRLVTGQTISFDDGPASPPFDRIVPGEVNTFNNYPQTTKITKPPTDPYHNENIALSQRFVSGGTNKDYNSQPYQPFAPPPSIKKDNANTHNNNNNYYNLAENTTFNSSTQDFFDTYLRNDNSPHEVENSAKSNQYPKNKFANLPSGPQNYDPDKRDNYFQGEKLANPPKPSTNAYVDDFANKNQNPHFQHNYPSRPNSHLPPENKQHKPLENIQYINTENKSNDDAYSENRRSSFDNFGNDQPPFSVNYDANYNQKHNAIPQRTYAEENSPLNVETKNRNEPSNYAPSTHKPDNFQMFGGNYYTPANQAENTSNDSKYLENPVHEHMEKVPFHPRADFERNKKDDPGYDMNSGRMAIEGSSDNASYSKPVASSSMQMQSPNYDYWYSNDPQKSFSEKSELKNINDQTKLVKEQNAFHANKYRNEKLRDEKPHNLQNVPLSSLDNGPPRLISSTSATTPAPANPYDNTSSMHSKTQSMSSNTSSVNENSPYQPNENYNGHETLAKRYDHHVKPDISDNNGSSGAYNTHNYRANETVVDKNKLIGRPSEPENFTNDLKPYPQPNDNIEALKNYEIAHQNFENIPPEEQALPNHGNEHMKPNQETYPEEVYANRDTSRKDLQQGAFVDQRKSANIGLEVPSGVDHIKDVNLKSPYRKNSLVGNEERISSDGLSLERGTVPGAQSTPNDVQSNRSFINANNSSSYNSTNLFKTIEDEDEREEIARYTDSDEKPMNRRTVLGYSSNTIPGPRSVSRKMGREGKFNKINKMEPPLEGRMVVGETSNDMPTGSLNRSRNDRAYEDDKPRRIGGSIHAKDKDSSVRYDRDRKKPLYRRDHRKQESDDEDYEDFGDRAYDNSPDRESRTYRDKHYPGSPRHLDKRSSRRDHESSFTQSQDESYFDDDDDDYDYRSRRRYHDRRHPKDYGYKYHDAYFREGYRDRRMDFYGRYEEESNYGRDDRNSRPSSRSGSEFRRDYLDCSNPRYYPLPPYYEYLDHRNIVNFGAGPRLSKRQTEYWSRVREMEPQKYMNWFKTTFQKEYYDWYLRHVKGKIVQTNNTYQENRRGSGHSGQSSVNDTISVVEDKLFNISRDLPEFKPVPSEISTIQETRCSPAKFTIPHVKGVFNALGQLVVVNASSPQDGQSAIIDFYQISSPESDADYMEFMNFTGPFIVGETHVNTLSDFVRYHANITPYPSAKLLYQLIELIIKLRGVTDGIAISELLMGNYRESQKFNPNVSKEDPKLANNVPPQSEIIETYTDLLLLGNKNAALEYAVNNKLWGHAFLLASKMGSKHYSKVLAKFDNSISMNNPLKTLYQLYSKQIPQASTACADEKWGDWRPHLAMMLSNPTSDGEFDKQAIITLGDSLACKDVFASHFCYLAAQADFDPSTKSSAKYTLLTLKNNVDNFGVNAPNHAILLTQVYEFAKRLQKKDFTINALLPYKYLLATRLVDYGKASVALQYLESIALDLLQSANDQDQELIYNVIELSERLKYSDAKPLEGDSSSDKQWLINLRQLTNNNYDNQISHSTPWNEQPTYAEPQPQYSDQSFTQQQPRVLGQQQYIDQAPQFVQNEVQQPLFVNQQPSISQPMSLPLNLPPQAQQTNKRRPSQPWENNFNPQEQRNITSPDYGYAQQDQYNASLINNESLDANDNSAQQTNDQYDQTSVADNQPSYYSPWDQPQQSVSISSHSGFSYYDADDNKKSLQADSSSRNHKEENHTSQIANKDNDKNTNKDKKPENNNNASGGGWLGGIFGKLSLRPKNEMKLPDDKNPSIVWSEEKKRWVNVNGDDDDGANVIKPPPRASELKAFQPQGPSQTARPNEIPPASNSNLAPDRNKPPAPGSGNIYKLSRGKGMKANYVNVLSQNTAPSNTNVPPPGMIDYSKPQVPSNMNLFTPSSDGPTSMPNVVSSHSKPPDNLQARNTSQDMPMFFNPAQYNT